MSRAQPISRDHAILALILLAALVLRIPGLNGPLWYDEILTLDTHLRLPWARMMDVYSMNHHYLYSFEAKALMGVFGEAPWVLRLPALAFGLAGIAAAWWLARMLGGASVAHVAAALLAVSFHHIWFSQNARGYTELAFFCTIAMGLFLHAMAAPRLRNAFGFALLLALAVFTHLTGAFFFFALGLVWAALAIARRLPGELVRWGLIAFGLGVLVTLMLYAPVIPSLTHTVSGVSEETAQSAVPQYGNPVWTVVEAVRTGMAGGGALMALVALALIGLSLLGALRTRSPAPLFGAAVLVHILVTMLLLWLIGMRIWPRFFFLDIGFLMILVTLGVREACALVAQRTGTRTALPLFGLGAAAMLAISAVLAMRNYAAPKQDLAGAVAATGRVERPGERVYAVGYAGDAFVGHFHTGWNRIMTAPELARALAPAGPVTLVVGFPDRTFAAIPDLRGDLAARRLRQVARLPGTLGDGAVLILQR